MTNTKDRTRMARRQTIDDAEVIARLSQVFRDAGYGGASLSLLADAAGLKKASLYHRFPGGKEQMAREVIGGALTWYQAHVVDVLNGPGLPAERVAQVAANLDVFHAKGQKACLFNMLAAPRAEDGPFTEAIHGAFTSMISAFAKVARDGGADAATARVRAHKVVMLLQGALVVTRGLQSPQPFALFLAGLSADLLGPDAQAPKPSRPSQSSQSSHRRKPS